MDPLEGLVIGLGMIAGICWLSYCWISQPPSESSQHNTGPAFNIDRQRMLERMALSGIPYEQAEFDRIFGRPLYRERNYDHNAREAIMYIADKEGWEYLFIGDCNGSVAPDYYARTQGQYEVDCQVRRARMLSDCTVRQKRYMGWYNESRYGKYVPYIFPEQFDCYDDYYQAVSYEYSKM